MNLLRPLAFDGQGDGVSHHCQRTEGGWGERFAGEHRHNPHQPIFNNQGVTREGNHPFPLGPFLVADAGIFDNGVGQVRLFLLSDQANLELPEGDTAVRSVDVGVHPRAGP